MGGDKRCLTGAYCSKVASWWSQLVANWLHTGATYHPLAPFWSQPGSVLEPPMPTGKTSHALMLYRGCIGNRQGVICDGTGDDSAVCTIYMNNRRTQKRNRRKTDINTAFQESAWKENFQKWLKSVDKTSIFYQRGWRESFPSAPWTAGPTERGGSRWIHQPKMPGVKIFETNQNHVHLPLKIYVNKWRVF